MQAGLGTHLHQVEIHDDSDEDLSPIAERLRRKKKMFTNVVMIPQDPKKAATANDQASESIAERLRSKRQASSNGKVAAQQQERELAPERQESNPVAELGISSVLHRSPRSQHESVDEESVDSAIEMRALTPKEEDPVDHAEENRNRQKTTQEHDNTYYATIMKTDVEFVRFRRSDVLEEFLANPPDEGAGGWAMFRYKLGFVMESTAMRFTVAIAIILNALVVG